VPGKPHLKKGAANSQEIIAAAAEKDVSLTGITGRENWRRRRRNTITLFEEKKKSKSARKGRRKGKRRDIRGVDQRACIQGTTILEKEGKKENESKFPEKKKVKERQGADERQKGEGETS